MPIDSKECFAALTEDGQLWEIYQAAQTGGGGITSINGDTTAAQLISGTAPITASTAAGTTTISTSMNTARLLGRTTAGVGVAEEISVGTGLSLAGGTLTNTIPTGVTSVTATAPLTSSGGTTPAISIADAVADGATKGAAAFNANDFNSASGVISLDYTNGQSASSSNKGFLTSTDWTTFNNKIGAGAYTTQTGLTMNTSRLLGRTTASSGAAEEISVGTGLSLTSGTLSVTGGGATNLFIPASAWIPRTTNGCGVDSRELATNRTNWDELLFDPGTDEFAQALTILPNNYNLGTITARFYWTGSGATDGSDDVIWGIQGRAFADADDLDIAFGTAQTVTDTLAVINDMQISAATSAVTIGGTPAANRPILFQIYRDADAGGDNYGHDARLLGVEILFN